MAGNTQASNFKASELLDAVDSLDTNKNGVTLEELRKTSRYYSEKLMSNLRSAAAELRTEKNPNPEKVAALRASIERLAALNGLKASQEQEIKSLYNGEMKDFYDLFAELKTRLDALKAEVSAPKADKASGAETVVVADAKAAKPTAAAAETVVVAKDAKPAAPKAETKETVSGFVAKREFLTADESLFQNAKGERIVGFGRPQLKRLLADPAVVANEQDLDRLVMRLAGAPINVKNEEESKKVRADFIENLSLRIVAISSLFERTVGEKLRERGSSGGLLHILSGQEGVLVKRMFDVADSLEKKGEGRGWNVTFQDIADTLKSIGLGAILGPVYLDWRTHKGIASEEIKTGGKTDKFGWATSDSKQNLEVRVTPAFKLFGFALGIAVEVNANLNDREREIIGKVKEAATAYDSLIDPATGKMDETKVPKEYLEDAKEFNRAFEAMRTGDAVRDKAVSKAVRDAYLFELTDRLVRADAGWELKGVGAWVALLFGIVPVKAFVKANGEKISATVTDGKVWALTALDALRRGSGAYEKYGISMTKTPEGYEYAIDPSRGYEFENRTDLKVENGVVKSKKPLYFKHLEIVSDTLKEGEATKNVLVISDAPIDVTGRKAEAAKGGPESIYVAESNDALRNEVATAMRGITSRHIRERITGIPALQDAIAKAYASGNPEGAYKLLSQVKVEGKKPLAALAAAHAKDKPEQKRELLNMVLQETAGDWRIRNFDAIKTDPKAFKDFVERTGYKGTQKALKLADVTSAWDHGASFDRNLLSKTGLGKDKDNKEALAALAKARAEYSKELGKLESIGNNTRDIKNAIGFVNFHQVAIGADGKSYKRFQEVVPVSGTVKAVNVEPTKFESAAMRRQLVAEIPNFVLESLRATINQQAKSAGVAEIGSVEDVRKLLMNNGKKGEGAFRPDIQLTSELAYTRFAKCLNDTYLIQNISLCVTGPNGEVTCAPTIPEVTSDLLATVGTKETNATNVAAGVAFTAGTGGGGKGGDNPNNPNGTTTPGVTPGGSGGTVTGGTGGVAF